MVVADHKRASLMPHIQANVMPGSTIFTDALRSYRNLGPEYAHALVDHMVELRQRQRSLEHHRKLLSCLKRKVKGSYICPHPFHMTAYVDEQVFRFNEREDNDAGRFVKALKGTDGKRVTLRDVDRLARPVALEAGSRSPRALAH